jgi:hypothetical protein
MLNISYRKVGGLRFVKIGRLTFMWCVSRRYSQARSKPLHAGSRRRTQRAQPVQPLLLTGLR